MFRPRHGRRGHVEVKTLAARLELHEGTVEARVAEMNLRLVVGPRGRFLRLRDAAAIGHENGDGTKALRAVPISSGAPDAWLAPDPATGPSSDRVGGRSPLRQRTPGRPVVSLEEPAPAGDLPTSVSRSSNAGAIPPPARLGRVWPSTGA
jgi:hypothetical protein